MPPGATGSGESVFVMDRSASPAAIVRDPPVVETDWLVPDGGLLALVLGSLETRYVPDTQFGVVRELDGQEAVVRNRAAGHPDEAVGDQSACRRRCPGADCRRDRRRAAEAGRNGDVGVLDAAPDCVMRTRSGRCDAVLQDGRRDGIAARITEGDGRGRVRRWSR